MPVATATLNLGAGEKADVPIGYSRTEGNILFKTNSNHIKSKSHYDFMKTTSPEKLSLKAAIMDSNQKDELLEKLLI